MHYILKTYTLELFRKRSILKSILTVKGGSLNFDITDKISDFANFLPSLNKVNSFLIILFSSQNE